eukprot:EG_transcript_12387
MALVEASTTICVGNLPDHITPREFRLMFKFAAGVQRCIINHTKSGHQVGYARFGTPQEAQAAIEWLHGYPLDEDFPQTLKVFMSSTQLRDALPGTGMKRPLDNGFGGPAFKIPRGGAFGGFGGGFAYGAPAGFPGGRGLGKGRGRGKGGAVASPTSVYVGGVPHDWDETALQSLFEGFGTISKVQLTRGSNPVGNIAFIHFTSPEEAQGAIQSMNNYPLDETRHLVVRANTSAKGL